MAPPQQSEEDTILQEQVDREAARNAKEAARAALAKAKGKQPVTPS
jgi:hypothetical protein